MLTSKDIYDRIERLRIEKGLTVAMYYNIVY